MLATASKTRSTPVPARATPAHGAISLIAPASPQRPRLMVGPPPAYMRAKDALSNIRTSEEGPSRAAMCNQLAACYARAEWWYGPGVAGLKRSLPAATR